MRSFLEYSQDLKEEIKNETSIIQAIKLCFLNEIESFQKGTEHEVYRLGKTKSGAFLVLRKKKFDFNVDVERFEIYCRNAEALSNVRAKKEEKYRRPDSPNFCIGVIYKHQSKNYLGVITQDMSEGGKYEMSNRMGSVSSERTLNEVVVDEVDVDLDGCHVGYLLPEEIIRDSSYFAPKYVLEI
jgi:hypothetical protein